jgi:hypothetical protein
MRSPRIPSLIVSLALAGGPVAAPAAAAQTATFRVRPATVTAGQHVRVRGHCEANTFGWVVSRAFRHTRSLDFAGVAAVPFATDSRGRFAVRAHIPARRRPGRYLVTVRCGGGNLGVERTLTVRRPHDHDHDHDRS